MRGLYRGTSVKDLYGGRTISKEAVRNSMRELERHLTSSFDERVRLRLQLNEQVRMYQRPLTNILSKDRRLTKSRDSLKRFQVAAQKRKRPHPEKRKETTRIFSGSIGATVAPPFDYQWTWNAASGSPSQNSESADSKSGDMSISIWTDLHNGSAVSGRAAVGIYFYPPAENGTLQLWSNPSFSDDWGDWCIMDSASADGWMGFYVGSYDLTGAPTGAVIDQQVSLWNDSSWWSGVGEQIGSNSAFGLNPSPIRVDQAHQYIIWIWCGGDVSGAGWGGVFGSGAGDDLGITVPSITWELG